MTYKVDIFGLTPIKMEGRHVSPMDMMALDIPAYDVVITCLKDIQKNTGKNWENMELLRGCIDRLMLAYNDLEGEK
mgnify:FL=1